jgi:hypothetical protein
MVAGLMRQLNEPEAFWCGHYRMPGDLLCDLGSSELANVANILVPDMHRI